VSSLRRMKKLPTLVCLAFVFSGCASTTPEGTQMCIMQDDQKATTTMYYDGRTVGFCCSKCKGAFEALSDEEKQVSAVHEAGHALLTVLLPHADPIHKVTIIPRGMALGLTQQLPVDDKHNYSRDYLEDQIAILLGGRIAEELTQGDITTGAGNDLDRATDLARKMVCEWGMSDEIGPLTFGKKEEQIFLGRDFTQQSDYSSETAIRIDQEIKVIATRNYDRARATLGAHKAELTKIAEELLIREVLDADQVRRIVRGETLTEPVAARKSSPSPPAGKADRHEQERPIVPVPSLDKAVPQE